MSLFINVRHHFFLALKEDWAHESYPIYWQFIKSLLLFSGNHQQKFLATNQIIVRFFMLSLNKFPIEFVVSPETSILEQTYLSLHFFISFINLIRTLTLAIHFGCSNNNQSMLEIEVRIFNYAEIFNVILSLPHKFKHISKYW